MGQVIGVFCTQLPPEFTPRNSSARLETNIEATRKTSETETNNRKTEIWTEIWTETAQKKQKQQLHCRNSCLSVPSQSSEAKEVSRWWTRSLRTTNSEGSLRMHQRHSPSPTSCSISVTFGVGQVLNDRSQLSTEGLQSYQVYLYRLLPFYELHKDTFYYFLLISSFIVFRRSGSSTLMATLDQQSTV